MSTNNDAGGERRALLIGNGTYQDAELRDLRAPTGDVESLGAVLSDPTIGGFRVSCAIDTEIRDAHARIESFFRHSRPSDLLLLYITCHGILTPDGQLLFATPTTDMELPLATTIASAFVWNAMEECRARSIVLIVDCCHSGAFGPGLAPKGVGGEGIPHDFDTTQARGRAVITACGHLQYAVEDTREGTRGSVFTTHIVEGLRTGAADVDRDGLVSVEDLYGYVFDRMRDGPPGGPLPKRKIDASGNLLVARNPRWPPASGEDDVDPPVDQRDIDPPINVVDTQPPVNTVDAGPTVDVDESDDPANLIYEAVTAAADDEGPVADLPESGGEAEDPEPRVLHHDAEARGVTYAGAALVASVSEDATARLWDLGAEPAEQWRRVHAHRGRPARGLLAVAASPEVGLIATAGRDGVARVWDLAGHEQRRVAHRQLRAVALSRDGARLATAGDDRKARVWSIAADVEERRVYDDAGLNGVAFSPGGTALARAGDDHLVRVWGLLSPTAEAPVHEFAHDAAVWDVAYSPDGRAVASASSDGSATVWELSGGKARRLTHQCEVWAVAFSPDGCRVATAGNDGWARVWDLAADREPQRFAHDAVVWALAFSPDGRFLATASADGSIGIWSV